MTMKFPLRGTRIATTRRTTTTVVHQLLLLLLLGTWCVRAQEFPAYWTSAVDSPGVSHRTDVCDRFQAFDRGEVPLRDALANLSISVLVSSYDLFNVDERGQINEEDPGLLGNIMDEVARRANFEWRNSFATTYGPEGNMTWTDLLLWGVDTYDVFVEWWAHTLVRLKLGVAFPQGFYDANLILIVSEKADTKVTKWFNWLEPFDEQVWFLIVVCAFYSGLLYQFLEFMGNDRDERTMTEWVCDNLYLSSLMFTQNFEYAPRTSATRLFAVSMAMWALLLSATYTANLASFFVEQNSNQVTIETIDDVINGGLKLCTWKGTWSDETIKKYYRKAKRVPLLSEPEILQGLRDGVCDVGILASQSWQLYQSDPEFNKDCSLRRVGRTVQFLQAGFATVADAGFKCTSLVRDVLNVHLVEMKSEGWIDQAWQHHYDARISKTVTCVDPTPLSHAEESKLHLNEMAGTFLLHFSFSIIAILLGIFNKYYHKRVLKNLEGLDSTIQNIGASVMGVSSRHRSNHAASSINKSTTTPKMSVVSETPPIVSHPRANPPRGPLHSTIHSAPGGPINNNDDVEMGGDGGRRIPRSLSTLVLSKMKSRYLPRKAKKRRKLKKLKEKQMMGGNASAHDGTGGADVPTSIRSQMDQLHQKHTDIQGELGGQMEQIISMLHTMQGTTPFQEDGITSSTESSTGDNSDGSTLPNKTSISGWDLLKKRLEE